MSRSNSASSAGYMPSFKERKSFPDRIRMVQEIQRQQPDKIPIIIERFDSERNLPILDHCKYLVPAHITVADVMQIIRRRLALHPDQAFYLLINEKSMASITMTVGQVYEMEKDKDGFLYIVYASQPAFG
ncbi:autophagy protein atg8 ubiquitin like domain-containing protein [Ditylenchus destructor]|nr:autophagy protein atg8 ubiquitin like domain-containing protein [Ditylenchus destructor]